MPQGRFGSTATRSPMRTELTSAATITTSPAYSWPGTSGSFKGSFELTDSDTSVTPNKNLVRKADFQGMIVDDGTEPKGYGFFLLAKMPTASPKTTLATSPKLSGSVLLEKVNHE